MRNGGGRLRLGVVLDAALEGWPSMDYVGEMLVDTLLREHSRDVEVSPFKPWTPRLMGGFGGPAQWTRTSIDRLVARCAVYPAVMLAQRSRLDAFHIVDHSYAHVAHVLPKDRTGIYCHDLDALRPLFGGVSVGRYQAWLARSVLRALQRAAVVFYSTDQMRRQIVERGLLDESKLVHAPYGVAMEFVPFGPIDADIAHLLPQGRFILHVGSGAPRKRLEMLFHAFAALRTTERDLVLVQQGATLSTNQEGLLDELGIRDTVVKLPWLSRRSLATLYRRASLVVLPSEREGFGLPAIEALACGTALLVNDIPAFREVAAGAAQYCSAPDSSGWAEAMRECLRSEGVMNLQKERLRRAQLFTWSRHAHIILRTYQSLA